MIEIKEVKTKKDIKTFVDFPTKLYEGCPYYSYPFRSDEMGNFNPKKNLSLKDCEVVTYLAYRDGEVVGRIQGIIQKIYNKKVNENRVRFSRFDSINDVEVARALLGAVENWAKEKGMDIVHGPLGYSDLDREGMLIEGFDEMCTFEEWYNYPYYKDLMEACGYTKDVDWLERKLYPSKEVDPKVARVADIVEKRYKLKKVDVKSKKEFFKRYKEGIFEVLDLSYNDLYGVVPYTDELKEQLFKQFKQFIELKYCCVIVDENDKVVCFGVAIPALNKAVKKSKGRLTLPAIFKLLHALKHPTVVDFAIIGVRPEWLNKGVNSLVLKYIMANMESYGVKYCETNLCLEDNVKINQTWEYIEHDVVRRRRAFIKRITNNE